MFLSCNLFDCRSINNQLENYDTMSLMWKLMVQCDGMVQLLVDVLAATRVRRYEV